MNNKAPQGVPHIDMGNCPSARHPLGRDYSCAACQELMHTAATEESNVSKPRDAIASVDMQERIKAALADLRDKPHANKPALYDLLQDILIGALEAAAHAPQAGIIESHKELMRFYNVDSLEALVDAQHGHIEKLQTQRRPDSTPAVSRPREG